MALRKAAAAAVLLLATTMIIAASATATIAADRDAPVFTADRDSLKVSTVDRNAPVSTDDDATVVDRYAAMDDEAMDDEAMDDEGRRFKFYKNKHKSNKYNKYKSNKYGYKSKPYYVKKATKGSGIVMTCSKHTYGKTCLVSMNHFDLQCTSQLGTCSGTKCYPKSFKSTTTACGTPGNECNSPSLCDGAGKCVAGEPLTGRACGVYLGERDSATLCKTQNQCSSDGVCGPCDSSTTCGGVSCCPNINPGFKSNNVACSLEPGSDARCSTAGRCNGTSAMCQSGGIGDCLGDTGAFCVGTDQADANTECCEDCAGSIQNSVFIGTCTD